MKFIHTGDIHLGSNIRASQYDFPSSELNNKVEEKIKYDVDNSLRKISIYAKEHNIRYILIAGDLFDNVHVPNNIYNKALAIFEEFKEINYLYILGNHDNKVIFDINNRPSNLLMFDDKTTHYDFGDLVVYGYNNLKKYEPEFYDAIKIKDPSKTNVVMMHGYVTHNDLNSYDSAINIDRLKDKHINYLALGHFHVGGKEPLGNDGICVMCGNPVGRDFGMGELGDKGFYEVDTEDILNPKFVSLNNHYTFEKIEINVDNISSFDELCLEIANKVSTSKVIRLTLTGSCSFLLDIEQLKNKFIGLPIEFIDETTIKQDVEKLATEDSLKGEFIRKVRADTNIDKAYQDKIIDTVLKEFKR